MVQAEVLKRLQKIMRLFASMNSVGQEGSHPSKVEEVRLTGTEGLPRLPSPLPLPPPLGVPAPL